MQEVAFPDESSLNRIADWRPHWSTQALSGSETMPAMSTRRVARSITNRTAKRVSRLPVQTSTVKKSAAARTLQ